MVIETVKEIRKLIETMNPEEIRLKYSDFYKSYPTLFNSCIQRDFDMDMLQYICKCNNSIDENNINEIDKAVVDKLNKKYIEPLIQKS